MDATTFVVGCLAVALLSAAAAFGANEIYRDPTRSIDERVRDLMQRMTLAEKVEQLSQSNVDAVTIVGGAVDEASINRAFQHRSTGVLWVKVNDDARSTVMRFAAVQRYFRTQTRLGIPAITANEALHGLLTRGATIYPQFLALGCTWNPELAQAMGTQIAQEASTVGVRQVLAPLVEVVRDPRWGRVEECIGESPYLVGRMCVAYTIGLQGDLRPGGLADDKCLATLKHFAGYASPVNGINISNCVLGERELRSVYFPPFERVIRETGALVVMPSYNEIDGVPSHANRWLLHDVLRGEMGFRGYTYSDWEGVTFNASLHHVAADRADAAREAIEAGVDLEAPGPDCYRYLPQLVEAGKVPLAAVDEAVRRVLYTKFVAGVFDRRRDAETRDVGAVLRAPDHIALSERIAEESIVLLKNENHVLPLDAKKLKSIAVIGPNADQVQFGDYSWSKSNADGVTILRGLRERLGAGVKINYAKGCTLVDRTTDGFAAAVAAAKESDVAIVVLGDTSRILSGVGWEDASVPASGTVGEGYDVTDPVPPGAQQDLVRAVLTAGKPVVVVFLNGRPYSVPWMKEQVPAIVEAYYPGQQEGYAVADILLGRVNPSGRLSMSVPQSAGHIPTIAEYKPSGRGYYHQPGSPDQLGRDYVFSSPAPLWAFGYGLSYTEFKYSGLKVETPVVPPGSPVAISFTLENTGARSGQEVAQVYVHQAVSSVTTPVMKLAAFQKVALRPGESKRIQLEIPASELALWNSAMHRVIEPGKFSVMVAASAEDVRLRADFEVRGDGPAR